MSYSMLAFTAAAKNAGGRLQCLDNLRGGGGATRADDERLPYLKTRAWQYYQIIMERAYSH